MTNDICHIEIPEFITHIKLSKNKFVKIGGNIIFSSVNHFTRAKIKLELSKYLTDKINLDEIRNFIKYDEYYYKTGLKVIAPINYENVSMRLTKHGSREIYWKSPKKDYLPGWDIDNFSYPWNKAFNDVLVENKIFLDDNVDFIRESGGGEYIQCEDFKDRKLIFLIEKMYKKS